MSVVSIDDPHDARLAGFRALTDAARAARPNTVVAESRLVVRALLAAPRFRTRALLLTASAHAELRDAVAASADDPAVYLAPPATIAAVVGFRFHRGCVALGEERAPLSLDDLLATRPGLILALEGVSNPDNLGAIFRNAAAFGAGAIVLSPGSGDPLYRKAVRVSMGAVLRVPFTRTPDWPGTLIRLRGAGFTLVALTPDASAVEIGSCRVPERLALLLGAEGTGLGTAATTAADLVLTIRMAPGADSLNVATAAAIALHRLSALPPPHPLR